ncbi:MAG: threonine synthase [Gemmatimonadetes bacterium]|nr:threonine synthase [Gemmatimonadota bacterium]
MIETYLTHLECGLTGKRYDADRLQNLSEAGKPLLARYDLARAARAVDRDALAHREETLWRYAELLPVRDTQSRISLGEGYTPLLRARALGREIGHDRLYIKDETGNPTGSFKARGLALAVSRAKELGARSVSVPSAGNAAGATAAYAARAGLPAHVFMPRDVPELFVHECRALGAEVRLVDGLIHDCGRVAAEEIARNAGRFDLSTLKEPYRLEGKKTLGYEVAEQMQWTLPDVAIYPTGGGTGLVGMWKAFDEMEALGWIDGKRPRMISVQSDGCAPIVRAFERGDEFAKPWEGARTIADGLRVPVAVGDFLILRAVRESGGCAVSVSDDAMREEVYRIGRTEGVFAAPEGGATLAALRRLKESGAIAPDESVVLFNTGSGIKYHHIID